MLKLGSSRKKGKREQENR